MKKVLFLFFVVVIVVFAQEVIELPVSRYYFSEPECRYSVHHKTRHGPLVRSKVNIGDEVFHLWNCDAMQKNSKASLFCVAVNNCTVSDNERNIQIIDHDGCSNFPNILPDVSYDGDLSAGMRVHTFSMDVETTAVHFKCNIRMIFKENGICRRPQCGAK